MCLESNPKWLVTMLSLCYAVSHDKVIFSAQFFLPLYATTGNRTHGRVAPPEETFLDVLPTELHSRNILDIFKSANISVPAKRGGKSKFVPFYLSVTFPVHLFLYLTVIARAGWPKRRRRPKNYSKSSMQTLKGATGVTS